MLGLDQVLERFLRENPNGLSGAVNRTKSRPDPRQRRDHCAGPADGVAVGTGSACAKRRPRGGQGSNADETTKAVDSVIESLWKEDVSSDPNGQFTGWKRARDPRIGGVGPSSWFIGDNRRLR